MIEMKRVFLFLLILFHWVTSIAQRSEASSKKRSGLLICGHRGGFYSKLPENSFAAINNTVTQCHSSPVIVEVDVRRSKDGTLFIMHDESVDRTTNGQGLISELNDNYLKSLLLKNSNGEITKEKVPTFDSLVNYSKTREMILMLDIKGDAWEDVIQKITKANLTHKCIVLTFKPADSRRVYSLSASIKISCLIRNEEDWALIKELAIPTQNLIAYTNATTSQNLIPQFKNSLMMVMTDVSESAMKNVNPMTRDYYLEFIKKRRIDILITDYPVEVSQKIQ